jgi:hypothetical protein
MSEEPEPTPQETHEPVTPEENLPSEDWPSSPLQLWPAQSLPMEAAQVVADGPPEFPADPPLTLPDRSSAESPLFASFTQPEIVPPTRIPHLGHFAMLAALALAGLLCAGGLSVLALHFHLFGISTIDQANADIHYTLGSMAIVYLATFAGSLIVFPLLWRKSFFAGIAWRGATALRYRRQLIGAAFVCLLLAIFNGWLLPGPSDAPIDRVFRSPGAAWLLFGFGITFAPFFEEIVFRGFLLPALCTACDWLAEKATHKPPPPLDSDGQPHWSLRAMVIGSVLTSLPFALMHGEQTGYSLGPFLLLVCVSMVLCWARLSARSLAASVLVHASYNFMLFSLMLFGTGGFRHLDKM